MDTLWVIVYSKFSTASRQLLDIISKNGLTHFKLLDIDGKNIRKRLKNDSTFKITQVPCIIHLDHTGVASLYQGRDAFDLIHDIIQPPQKPIIQPHVTFTPQPPKITTIEHHKENTSHTPIGRPMENEQHTNILDLDEPDEPIPIPKSSVGINTGKINVSSVLSSARSQMEEQSATPMQNMTMIKKRGDELSPPVKTGPKINISEIMASARS